MPPPARSGHPPSRDDGAETGPRRRASDRILQARYPRLHRRWAKNAPNLADEPASYHKVLSSSVKKLHGILVVTNHKVRFVSPTGGFEFPLSKLATVSLREPSGVVLQLTRSQGSGFYAMQGGVFLYEIMQVILNVHHRKVLCGKAASRSIPQAVKNAVWQRDGGKCVECGDEQYLEFDHVIPFTKGGASSENNLQLLCRRCNMSKSDKI